MRALIIEANQQPELFNVFSTFAADTPQLYLDLDRNKAQTLGVQINDVFTALQGTLGGLYVNDFNLFGRTWQVNIQADQDFRKQVDDIFKIHVRNAKGEMVPIRSLASVRLVLGPSALICYNLYRSVTINGSPAPGFSTGDALAAMERLSATTLPAGYGFEWTGTALQEKEAAGQTTVVLGLAILFAYLFLVALYESWNIPIPVLLSVWVGILGRDRRGDPRRPELRPLRPDRPGRADRARGQERHPDRRVRDGAARPGQVDRGGCDRGGAPAFPAGDDDQLRVHRPPGAPGDRHRRRLDQPPRGRHAGVRRHARGGARRDLSDPDAVRGVPVAARESDARSRRRRRVATSPTSRTRPPRPSRSAKSGRKRGKSRGGRSAAARRRPCSSPARRGLDVAGHRQTLQAPIWRQTRARIHPADAHGHEVARLAVSTVIARRSAVAAISASSAPTSTPAARALASSCPARSATSSTTTMIRLS